eukprot:scaffold40_cov66-Phaeocystis_antarctica.AAC.6
MKAAHTRSKTDKISSSSVRFTVVFSSPSVSRPSHLSMVSKGPGKMRQMIRLNVQRATATEWLRMEVKFGPCAQLSEAGS